MRHTAPVLSAKLAPSLAPDLVERGRLMDAFAPLASKRLALVVAGAGYGKTTFAAQALKHVSMQTIWYNLDADDGEITAFLRCLITGIRGIQAEFGETLLPALTSHQIGAPSTIHLLAVLAAEMEQSLHDHVAIVLDDFHAVGQSAEIIEAIELLLPRLPRYVHLVIVSRMLPDLRLSVYRARRELIDISERDLTFTREEVAKLLRILIPDALSSAEIDAFHEHTGGWAAALILTCNEANRAGWGRAGAAKGCGNESRRLIFQYLEENVFESQPEAIREFLVTTSLMDWLDPGLCDAFLGIGNSRQILEYLSSHHLLTFPAEVSEDAYRYHHLLQGFLQGRLRRGRSDLAIADLHRTLGELYEARGDKHHALRHYAEGKARDQICRLVSNFVIEDLVACPLELLSQAVISLPEEMSREYPPVLHVKARLLSVKGNLGGAIEGFRSALAGFRESGDEKGVSECLKDLGFHYYLTGNVGQASQQMEKLWEAPHRDPFFESEIGGYLVFFASILGRIEDADTCYDEALKLLSRTDGPDAGLGRLWLKFCHAIRFQYSGDFERAEALTDEAIEAFKALGAELLLPIAHVQAAQLAFYRRSPEKGLAHAEKGLELAERLGIFDHQYAWLLCTRARNSLLAGDLKSCLNDAHEASAIFKTFGNPWGHSASLDLLGQVSLARGIPAEAEGHMRTGLKLVQHTGLVVWERELTLGLVESLMAQARYPEAVEALAGHEEQWNVSSFNAFRRYLLRALLHEATGRGDEAVKALSMSLPLASRYGYDAWVVAHLKHLVPILAKSSDDAIDAAYVESLTQKANPELRYRFHGLKENSGDGTRRAAGKMLDRGPTVAPVALTISCLGDFQVTVGERVISRDDWRSSKAALIFQYLALNIDRGFIAKDVLLELAWPEQDPVLTSNRFHVALSFLRRLLEPGLRRGRTSSYIVRRGDAYRLEIGDQGEIDTRRFMKSAELAARTESTDPNEAHRLYVEAAQLYKGDLIPEVAYEEWLESFRIRFRNKYLMVLSKIMSFQEWNRQWTACIEVAEEYLCIEEFSEPVYRVLMRCHAALGDLSRVENVFRRGKKRITDDLGYPLSEESITLYHELTGSRGAH